MNPNSMQTSALWIPPVSKHDEITNIGFSLAIIEILEMIGLLVAKKETNHHASLHLPDDLHKKNSLLLCRWVNSLPYIII